MSRTTLSVSLLTSAFAAQAFAGAGIAERKTLTMDGARQVIAAGVAQAKRSNSTGVFAVVDSGGHLMALERVDGTFPAGANVAIGKARTAALFQKPTKAFEDLINKGRTAMTTVDFTPLTGGVPITADGQIIGAVGVSGASSAAQDEEFAMAAASGFHANGAAKPITFFDSQKVSAAFDKGAVLFDQGEKYMVHASRREKAGQVEIHEDDADIVYVLDGKATLVTGGTAIDAKTVGAGELRADNLNGGDTREIVKGDVIVIPAGTPHWFKTVTDPFLYYVVKAR